MAKQGLVELVGMIAVGGGMLYKAMKNHKRARLIEDTPRSKWESAPQGFVEVEGFAWPRSGTNQTLNGRDAVYYHLKLQKQETRGSGKNKRTEWVTVFEHRFTPPFYLVDPTGLGVIDPKVAECEIGGTSTRNVSSLGAEELGRLGTYEHGVSFGAGFFSKLFSPPYRVVESYVLLGSPLHASGNYVASESVQAVQEPALIGFAKTVFDTGSRGVKNIDRLLDSNKDGKVSAEEAVNGYTSAARHWANKEGDVATGGLPVHGVLTSSESHKLFFADRHERHLVNHLKAGFFWKVAGGGALMAAGITYILASTFGANLFERSAPAMKATSSASVAQVANPTVLHHQCVDGAVASCRTLVQNADVYHLESANRAYYRQRLCELDPSSTLCSK